MTDRYNYLMVVLEENTREDDAESIINAIKMIKGIGTVKPNVVDPNSFILEWRAKNDLIDKLNKVLS
jgi:hypothetical protein